MKAARARIGAVILAILADGERRGAEELTSLVRQREGLDKVQGEDVLATLSQELAGEAIRDEDSRWTLRARLAFNDEMSTTGRAMLLRAIHRLRSGLPPSESIVELTVGADRLLPAIENWLEGSGRGRRTLF